MKEAILYKKLKGSLVQCTACNHHCKIAPNKTGICGVRKNIDGKLNLLVHGRVISANIDPIEKKPLYHFLPGTEIFSIGTVGCNFGCDFCQNFDISQASKKDGIDVEELGFELPPQEIVNYCVAGGEVRRSIPNGTRLNKQSGDSRAKADVDNKICSIAFTYNEPTIFSEYAVDVMKLARKHKLYGVYVSNGYFTKECFNYIQPYIDAFNIDLKSFSDEYYRKVCKSRIEPVKESIKRVFHSHRHLEITTLLIPGKNNSRKEITDLAKFIKSVSPDIPWHISAFFPTYKMTDVEATRAEELFRAYEIGKRVGLNYIYCGNIANKDHSNTTCPTCKKLIIERDEPARRRGGIWKTKSCFKGTCPKCKSRIYGIWTI